MATIVHTSWLDLMLGDATQISAFTNPIYFDSENIDASLLDATDSGTITASTANYGEVDTATVVATTGVTVTGTVGGVVSASAITFSSVTGDAADYLTVFRFHATPASAPLAITWDSASTGLPVTPNGGDIVATFGSNQLVTLA